MQVTLPPMPCRVIALRADSGPRDIRCKSNGRGGPGCDNYLMFVGQQVFTTPGDGRSFMVERWDCHVCNRSVEVRWALWVEKDATFEAEPEEST